MENIERLTKTINLINESNERTTVLGIPVDEYSQAEVLDKIKNALNTKQQHKIIAINPKKIMLAREDEELKKIIKEAEILLPDSAQLGIKLGKRITGIDLMENICKEIKTARIFLYGAREESVKKAKENLEKKYEYIKIVGYKNGFTDNEEVIKSINKVRANIVFVGLGSPKQEKWIYNNKGKIKANIIMGVGGSIDVFSGRVKRAPKLIRKVGLEWLYRMIKEPRRFKDVPKFIQYLKLMKRER